MSDCREEEINISPLEANGNQEVFDFSPSPFGIKEPEFRLRQDGFWGGYESTVFSVCWFSK